MCKFKKRKFSWILTLLCCLLYVNLLLTFTRSAIIIFSLVLILLIILLHKYSFNIKTFIVVLTIISCTILIPGGKNFVSKTFGDVLIMTSDIQNILGFLPSDFFDKMKDDKETEFVVKF